MTKPARACTTRSVIRFAPLLACLLLVLAAPTSAVAAAPTAAEALVHKGLACACFEGGELRIDTARSLADPSCTCSYADTVRRDVKRSVGGLGVQTVQQRHNVALALEDKFLTASPDYERMFRYDKARYRWFLENVRCTCPGCTATVYFSNCQLACTPAVRYKRRARVFLALGFSVDDVIDYYLAEHNATHPEREQITRAWLLPKREKKRGWLVPALAIFGAILVLGLGLRRIVRRSAQTEADAASAAAFDTADPDSEVSDEERARILDALDDLEE